MFGLLKVDLEPADAVVTPDQGNPDAEAEAAPLEETGEASGDAEWQVRYSEIRDDVDDGDVFLFRGNRIISRLFQAGSHSKYSHSGLVGWWDRRLMLFQAELACVQAVPFSVAVRSYDGLVDWYKVRPEYMSQLNMDALLDEAKSNLGIAYGTTDLFRTILHELANLDLPPECETPHALFCSQYVARCFRVGGVPLKVEQDMAIFPSEIASSPVLMYMGTIVPDISELDARKRRDR